jgi:hypothetical protein
VTSWKNERILALVKASPQPSQTYGEAVCTAGLTQGGKWIRLYPVEYRSLPLDIRFAKWTWIEGSITKSSRDPRPESYNIDHDSIKLFEHIGTDLSWKKRREILIPYDCGSLENLQELHMIDKRSIGFIRPKEINGFEIEQTSGEWESKKLEALKRSLETRLFSVRKGPKNILEKIPFRFYYRFTCDHPDCKGHKLQILDWEVSESYRNWRKNYGSEEITIKKIIEKYQHELVKNTDLSFILGTIKSMDRFGGVFSIIGLFYPPKLSSEQMSFFS